VLQHTAELLQKPVLPRLAVRQEARCLSRMRQQPHHSHANRAAANMPLLLHHIIAELQPLKVKL
jgi:hypothetical protein